MVKEDSLVQIGSFSDNFQANFAKDILLSNEITCRVIGDAFQLIDVLPKQPISLQINSKDLQKAKELLELYFEL